MNEKKEKKADFNTIFFKDYVVLRYKDVKEITIEEEEDLIPYIKHIERIIRSSYEYKELMKFLKHNTDFGRCHFFRNIDTTKFKKAKVKIEIHHTPLTLFDIVAVLYRYNKANNKSISPFEISDLTMKLHYQNIIGLVPLTQTIHEMAHSGNIFINSSGVIGNWEQFVNIYEGGFSEEQIYKLNKIRQLSEVESSGQRNNKLLKEHFTYVRIDGVELPQLLPDKTLERMAV